MDFLKRYNNLNDAQKQAVDQIDGPVMVVAGPGTGKTELLSVRAANILKNTDTLPENILCLTFTDSGANAMRRRLADIIGKDAYKVAIHTFHSFGSEIINQNGQYFYQGAHFRPADELSSYEIMRSIFEKLKHNNPINSKLNGDYTYLKEAKTAISELKKSGLTSDELITVLDDNDTVIKLVEDLLSPIFATRSDKTTASKLAQHIDTIRSIPSNINLPTIVPLAKVLSDSLEIATNESLEINKTTPITAWRNQWFIKDGRGKYVLKSKARQIKLRAVSDIYEQYLQKMHEAELYDFDDMILRVVHAMEVFDDLRFNLQEKFQYIMVDEFQDTNMAQMRILHNLTNNEVQADTPNIMVVGDDDQAIYSFQGADIGNIIDFRKRYPNAAVITLTENYRSTSKVLDGSREIIIQGKGRLEKIYNDIDKKLRANYIDSDSNVYLHQADNAASERQWLADDIKKRINSGQKPETIAVLTRKHKEIADILPYLTKANIPISYERKDDVLEIEPIKIVEQLARVLISINRGEHDKTNASLPELLAHKAWGIKPIALWKLSLTAYEKRQKWLEIMQDDDTFKPIFTWLIQTATSIDDAPLEQVMDIIIGRPDSTVNQEFVSPLYEYFFSSTKMAENPTEYLTYLEALRTIRSKLREYRPDQTPSLVSFINYIDLNKKNGSKISLVRQSIGAESSVNIMTAHKSKGLEFDTVYIINAVDNFWGEKARSHNRIISYPENLPLAPAGDSEDERLRLFYVAATRAKKDLQISYSLENDNGKNTMQASFLTNSTWPKQDIQTPDNIVSQINTAEISWYQPLIEPVSASMRDLLLPKLESYKLSATHLNNFLDVSSGGPNNFLISNLLRFPSAKNPSASFGTAIHGALSHAHTQLAATKTKQSVDDILVIFDKLLNDEHLSKQDFDHFMQKGHDILTNYLSLKYDDFKTSQRSEQSFSYQQSKLGDAHLTGSLDVMDVDVNTKTVIVTDYKTGKPASSWRGNDGYEKIKLHKYRQQLMFYKLLVESARDWRGYTVASGIMQFVEPSSDGEILNLQTDFDNEELTRFKLLIESVWSHIKELNLPDTSMYEPSYKGMLAFENDLIDKVI